jgi:serine/threonine-protein kinase
MTAPLGGDALRTLLQARLGAQYTIESLLGQGGMGSVYRAMDQTLHRPVAVKVISGDVASNPELKSRFLQEARTVAKLRHPNIVAVYSAGDADGLLYFVMELVPGESLRDLIQREGKVEPARAERILHELALALDYAHANGIVHRDVKPENILLDRETGRAMLTDFGVARALENSGNMTGTGMILGSPRYMSPEQATGEATIDGRSDLYALALVGYEMFTGKPVVDSGNVAGMLVKHLTETPKPIAEAVASVPEGAAVAIDRALAKNRDERWATGREMAEVIGMAWTPTPGAGTSRLASIPVKTKKSPGPAIAMIGSFVAIAASLVAVLVSTSSKKGGDPRKSYAVVPFEVQSGNAEVQWLRDGAVNMLTMALGQWTDLQVVEYERTLKLVSDVGAEGKRVDLDRAQEIAKRGGAGTVVMGLITTTADSMVVVARLYDAKSGKSLNTATRATALGADPRPLFDDLARYLLDVAGGQSSASVDVARATTTSLTAYRAYLDGVRYLNSWRLRQADSALQVAIRADSTFALAWHKRALALGWGDGASTTYVESARRAVELSDRLPPRQQALVRGHLGLVEGLTGTLQGEAATARLREAQRIYEDLLATDSLVAEGWYGLADAYFHDNAPLDSIPLVQNRLNRSMRGFHRTLMIDSSFHLAYQHLVQQYQGLSSPSSGGVLVGDSVVIVRDEAQIASLGGPAGIAKLRSDAQRRGLEIARGWVRADIDAPAPHLALATGLLAANQSDSALAVIERALARPALQRTGLRLQSVTVLALADDPRAFARMREVTTTTKPEEFRETAANERLSGFSMALNTAAAVGNGGEITRLVDLMATIDPSFPFTQTPTREFMSWYATGLRVGIAGTITAEQRRILAVGTQRVVAGAEGVMAQVAATSGAIIYTGYLATRDTMFSNAFRKLSRATASGAYSDLEALEALQRGDTAAARAIAESFTHPDSVAKARLSFAGLRVVARAEALAAVGNRDWALRYLEALDAKRFSIMSLAEPGFAAFTRSFATRGRLYEEAGDRAKAITAYQEFLRRTEAGDAAIAPQRREVRAALDRLRDSTR